MYCTNHGLLSSETLSRVLYYSMKLKVHNMTIYNNATGYCHNHWWHEANGELEASVFVSIIVKHLQKYYITEKKPIILYSDGCGTKTGTLS